MADVAYAQGDRKAGDAHMLDAHRALGNYNRKCL
jgi:hypothetical protein